MNTHNAIIAVVFGSVLIGDPVNATGAAGASNHNQVGTDNTGPVVTGYGVQYLAGGRGGPVLVEDHFVETRLGNPDGVPVSVVDAMGFDLGAHGQRITDVFLANTSHASLLQIGGWGTYLLNEVTINGINARGFIRHVLNHDGGIFWTASDMSPRYSPQTASQWFVENDRAFSIIAREVATWMQDRNTLFISSMENSTGSGSGLATVPVYCDDFEGEASGGWVPLCGALDDYIAHSGVGLANTLFVGAIDARFGADEGSGAIRADGVFAPHAIYVESPDGSTSQATPILAAYATNLAVSNPSWGAERLKQELMSLTREEVIDYFTGAVNSRGTGIIERRKVKVIRPEFAPKANPPALPPKDDQDVQDALDFPHFANGISVTSDLVLVNVAPHPIRPDLFFYDQGGDRIAAESVVEITGDLTVTEDGALTVQTELEPLGELTISTAGRGEVVSGSVRVVSNGSIGGVLRFDIPGIGVAGVGAGQPVRDALFPARRQVGGIRTAAAIHNLEAEAVVVKCRLMQDGAVLEEVDISLEANGQDARFIEELFTATDTSNFVGSVRCTAEGLFTGVALEMDADNGILTTVPVVPVER